MTVMMMKAIWMQPSWTAVGTPMPRMPRSMALSGRRSPNFSLMPVRRRRIATNVTVTLMACASVVPNAAPEGPRRSQPINR